MTTLRAVNASPEAVTKFPLRDAKARATRRRIFDAATELFSKTGYHATTVSSIVERAGVAKGTFFVHFSSKAAIVTALVEFQTQSAHAARAEALAQGGPLAALRAATMTLGERASESLVLSRGVLAATLESPEVGDLTAVMFDRVLEGLREDARAAKREGLLRPDVDADLLAGSLMGAYLGTALAFTSRTHPQPLMSVLTPLVDFTLDSARARSRAPEKRSAASKKKLAAKPHRRTRS